MRAQSRERGLERAAGAAERGGLFLRDFVIERVGNGRGTAAERDHCHGCSLCSGDRQPIGVEEWSFARTSVPNASAAIASVLSASVAK